MQVTNYDPPITVWGFNVSNATVFSIVVTAETDHHIHGNHHLCLHKGSMPTFSTFTEAKDRLIEEIKQRLLKATQLEVGDDAAMQ